MRTQDYDTYTVDSDDAAAARDWSAHRTAAQIALRRAQARRAAVAAEIGRDPAASLLAAVDAARGRTASASAALTSAQERKDSADAAAGQWQANQLAQAQADLDVAIRAVADALAVLLKQAQSTTALTATVDGMALGARYDAALATDPPVWDHATIPFRAHPGEAPLDPELAFPALGEPDHQALLAVLDGLDQRIDSVADLVTAESVHQLVQGNTARSGAALDVTVAGLVPDELDAIRTPMPASVSSHRVLVLIDPALPAAWASGAAHGATLADPVLDAWAGHLLPDPASVSIVVGRVDPDSGVAGDRLELNAAALELTPLAWIQLGADRGELVQRIARLARDQWPATAGGRVEIEEAGGFADLLAAADAVRAALAAASALEPAHLSLPTDDPGLVDAGDVADRIAAVERLAAEVATALEAAPGLDALFAASALGDAGATPQLDVSTPTDDALALQARGAAARIRDRLASGGFSPDPADTEGTLRAARERVAALTGMRVPLLTTVPAGADLDDPGLADAATVREWLYAHARVRPALEALVGAFDVAETLGTGAALDLHAAQLGAAAGWLGSDPSPPEGSVGIVVQRAFTGALPAAVTGLAVDAWTQRAPSASRVTGVAFHYDEPDATPPQAVLIAVAPDLTDGRQPGTWDLDTLLDTLTTTLALARERAVTAERSSPSGITFGEQTS